MIPYKKTDIEEIEFFKPRRVVLTFGFGVNHDVSKYIQIFVQPTFRVYFNTEVTDFFEDDLKSLGLELGVRRAISLVE